MTTPSSTPLTLADDWQAWLLDALCEMSDCDIERNYCYQQVLDDKWRRTVAEHLAPLLATLRAQPAEGPRWEPQGDDEARIRRALHFVQENPHTANAWGLDTAVNIVAAMLPPAPGGAKE